MSGDSLFHEIFCRVYVTRSHPKDYPIRQPRKIFPFDAFKSKFNRPKSSKLLHGYNISLGVACENSRPSSLPARVALLLRWRTILLKDEFQNTAIKTFSSTTFPQSCG